MLVGQGDRARHNIRIETGLGHERACARTCPVKLLSTGQAYDELILTRTQPRCAGSTTKLPVRFVPLNQSRNAETCGSWPLSLYCGRAG